MRNLINFILKYSAWFVFIFYVILSCILLFRSNPYQHHIYLTSANKISTALYNYTSNITSYFYLRDINEDLQQRNASLEMEVINLKNDLREYQLSALNDSLPAPEGLQNYQFIMGHVINNSISKPYNYITINKGSADGIIPEMGVVDQNGVVGIVNVVGEHSARIISLLNPHFRLSCKVKNSEYFGSLVWDGENPYTAILEEMPRHIKFQKGDTIVTSGYSAVFPEGIIVGTILDNQKATDDNFYTLRIKLFTDFSHLSTVRAIKTRIKDEITEIEKEQNND